MTQIFNGLTNKIIIKINDIGQSIKSDKWEQKVNQALMGPPPLEWYT